MTVSNGRQGGRTYSSFLGERLRQRQVRGYMWPWVNSVLASSGVNDGSLLHYAFSFTHQHVVYLEPLQTLKLGLKRLETEHVPLETDLLQFKQRCNCMKWVFRRGSGNWLLVLGRNLHIILNEVIHKECWIKMYKITRPRRWWEAQKNGWGLKCES